MTRFTFPATSPLEGCRMNLILVTDEDFLPKDTSENTSRDTSAETVVLRGRRFEHIRSVHRAQVGDQLRVGRLNGKMGSGRIVRMDIDSVELALELTEDPPSPPPVTLLLALPRPKFLSKVLQTAASIGVKDIYLFNTFRVDKIYWHCEQLKEASVREALILGLEQSRDTILPNVHLRRLFKPFVEDELPSLVEGKKAFVAHPSGERECPYAVRAPFTLAVGPEGGFIDYEIKKLQEAGFDTVRLFPRILKVETAVSFLLGRLL